MNFCIKQLNFLYLYKYCKENHLNVSAYDEFNIENIDEEDVVNIFKFLLFRENIISSLDEIKFSIKVEEYILQPDVVNLSEVGPILNKKIQTISKFKNELTLLTNNTNSREFINNFEVLMSRKREIKDILSLLNNTSNEKRNRNNNESKKRAASFLFS